MMEVINQVDFVYLTLLMALGAGAFTLSTLSGGGGALMMVPVVNALLGVSQTAPVINLGAFIGRPSRLILFWKHIQWNVCWYYIPSALIGSVLGASLFGAIKIEWLQVVVGLFLVSTLFQFKYGKKKTSFNMKLWYLIPLGLLISILGTIIGGLGPIMNPFYLNLNLDKEDLIATKTANSFFMGLAQISSYSFFGLLKPTLWIYGIGLGLGITMGNVIGKRFLAKMKSETFRKWVIGLMVLSGTIMFCRLLFNFTC